MHSNSMNCSVVMSSIDTLTVCRQITQKAASSMLSTVKDVCVNASWSSQENLKKQNGSTGN